MGEPHPPRRHAVAPQHTNVVVTGPQGPADVMIAPAAATRTNPRYDQRHWDILRENLAFAKQWQRFDPANRAILPVPTAMPRGPESVRSVFAQAVRRAPGHEVFLFIGHGGAATLGDPTNPDPEKRKPHLAAFDTLPEPGRFSEHACLVTEDVVTRARALRAQASGHGSSSVPLGVTPQEARLNALAQVLVDLGTLVQANPIQQLTILTCNVGQRLPHPTPGRLTGRDFVQALADVLRTHVRMYDGWIATDVRRDVPPNPDHSVPVQIWITRDHDHADHDQIPPFDPGFPESLHEVPDQNPRNSGHSVVCAPSP
ncbi:MAG: hypothetical protein FWD17_17995 [Polyangiaceae bacterium]|nr:hypothetical protein [Polyangiaceae bacterium]